MNSVRKNDEPIWLTEADVGACMSLNDAIEALQDGLALEARSEAANVDKALGTWGSGSSMHALGSMMPQRGYVGFKTWANTPNGATAVFSLFDANNGALLAMMSAGLLGKLRTSGISGLATRALALEGADDLAVIGTGVQSLMQVAAIAATRKLSRLRVFSPTAENRAKFVAQVREQFAFTVEDCPTLEAAVRDAPIITLITRSREPFLSADLVVKGAHINAAGAILASNAEVCQDIFARADLVVVDSIANARNISTEMREHFGTDPAGWAGVKTIGQVLDAAGGRPAGADITLFKPMGMGLSDLSVAVVLYDRARERQLGTLFPAGGSVAPRWTVQA